MELKRETHADADISAELTALTYAYPGEHPKEVVARVDFGDQSKPLSGIGGLYVLRLFIDDVEVVPTTTINLAAGKTRAILISRAIPIEQDDVIVLKVQGLSGDTDVDLIATLRDVTPVHLDDVAGAGSVGVDHDYGGVDNLIVAATAGQRINNATIQAFRDADYRSGRRSPEFVIATTTTDINGRWRQPFMLDPGLYQLLVFKQGVIRSRTYQLIVG